MRANWSLWSLILVGTTILALEFGGLGSAAAQAPESLENQVEPLEPVTTRSLVERDRVDAAAHFALGRILQRRGEAAAALKSYQQAYFWDPQARAVLPDLILMAAQVQRADVVRNYSLLAVRQQALTERQQQLPVAQLLSELGEYDAAAELYRLALSGHVVQENDWGELLAYFEWGRVAFLAERYAEAAQAADRIWDFLRPPLPDDAPPQARSLYEVLSTQSDQPLNLLLEIYLEAGQIARAREVADRLFQLHPDEALSAFRRAEIEFRDGNRDAALEGLQRYHESGSSEAGTRPYELLAEVIDGAARLEQPSEQLLATFDRWYQAQPDQPALVLEYAQLLSSAGQSDRAIGLYRQLITGGGVQEAYVGLLNELIARRETSAVADLLLEYQSLVGELSALDGPLETLQQSPLLDELRRALRTRAEGANGDPAAPEVGLALAVMSGSAEELNWWLPIAVRSGQPTLAQQLLEHGLDLIVRDHYALAASLLEAGRPLADRENRTLYGYYLAECYAQLDRPADALSLAEQAVANSVDPLRSSMQARYAWFLYQDGQAEAAERLLLELVAKGTAAMAESADQEPADGASEDASEGESEAAVVGPDEVRQCRLILGSIYADQHRADEAENQLMRVLWDDPEAIGASNDLAYLWADRGVRLQRSLTMLQRVVEAEPDNVAYRDSLGWTYYRLGRLDDAIRELRQACGDPDPDGVILDHLGDALLADGQATEAVATWQRALERLPANQYGEEREAVVEKIERQGAEVE